MSGPKRNAKAPKTKSSGKFLSKRRGTQGGRSTLKRRTLRRFSAPKVTDHHNVYVVLLDASVAKLRKVQQLNPHRDPSKPSVYVGMTGLTPEERFSNHAQGIKSSYFVKRYGIRLVPELYAHLNPMPFEAAAQMEKDLTEDLRQAGFTVTGGH